MTVPREIPDPCFRTRGSMFWLPPGGFGNGIPATVGAELADLNEDEVAPVKMDRHATDLTWPCQLNIFTNLCT